MGVDSVRLSRSEQVCLAKRADEFVTFVNFSWIQLELEQQKKDLESLLVSLQDETGVGDSEELVAQATEY